MRGQDLIEYALRAVFVALATTAMAPGITSSINVVFSKVNSVIILACVQLGSVRWMKPQLQEAFSADCR
jgi:Flp pilus assembly pilin Flp